MSHAGYTVGQVAALSGVTVRTLHPALPRHHPDAHRAHLSRWFYDVSAQMHLGLADM
jgi:hypothetical protein